MAFEFLKSAALKFGGKQTGLEKNLADAINSSNWSCPSSVLFDIARSSYDYSSYDMIVKHIFSILNEKSVKWRKITKAITLLEYILLHGSMKIVDDVRDNMFHLKSLTDFHFTEEGRDKGAAIRETTKRIIELSNDEGLLKKEREKAAANRSKYVGISSTGETKYSASGYFPETKSYSHNRENIFASKDEEEEGRGERREGRRSEGRRGEEREEREERKGDDKKEKKKNKKKKRANSSSSSNSPSPSSSEDERTKSKKKQEKKRGEITDLLNLDDAFSQPKGEKKKTKAKSNAPFAIDQNLFAQFNSPSSGSSPFPSFAQSANTANVANPANSATMNANPANFAAFSSANTATTSNFPSFSLGAPTPSPPNFPSSLSPSMNFVSSPPSIPPPSSNFPSLDIFSSFSPPANPPSFPSQAFPSQAPSFPSQAFPSQAPSFPSQTPAFPSHAPAFPVQGAPFASSNPFHSHSHTTLAPQPAAPSDPFQIFTSSNPFTSSSGNKKNQDQLFPF